MQFEERERERSFLSRLTSTLCMKFKIIVHKTVMVSIIQSYRIYNCALSCVTNMSSCFLPELDNAVIAWE